MTSVAHIDACSFLDSQSETAGLIYADIPYNSGQAYGDDTSDKIDQDLYEKWLFQLAASCHRAAATQGNILIHCKPSLITTVVRAFCASKLVLVDTIVVRRNQPGRGRHKLVDNYSAILCFSKSGRLRINHCYEPVSRCRHCAKVLSIYNEPREYRRVNNLWTNDFFTVKTRRKNRIANEQRLELMLRVVAMYSQLNDLVLDPCAGTGTTLLAAHISGRRYAGSDLSSEAVAIANDRLTRPRKSDSDAFKRWVKHDSFIID
jgi:site-specific DNA-methyltransferase (adenine-specific)